VEALRVTYWALSSRVYKHYSCLTTRVGAEDELLITTYIHSGFSWVTPVESLDGVFRLVETFCWVPNFVVFRWISISLSSILELLVEESRVDNFVPFIFVLSFYRNRKRWLFDLRGESVVLVRFEQGNVEGVVNGHIGW